MPKTSKTKTARLRDGKETFLTVTAATDLCTFLCGHLPEMRRKSVLSLLKHRQVKVDRIVVTQYNHGLKPGERVSITWTKVLQDRGLQGLRIVFEDPFLIVVDKPPGLLSIATDKEKERTAYRILSDQLKTIDPRQRIFIVHRLDREVSGLMLFAKSKEIQQLLQKAWDKESVDRIYVAVVEGHVTQAQGTITSWLKENQARRVFSSPTPHDGQKAVTHYSVLKHSPRFSLLEIRLETGRKNQIRVHMQEMGHPVAGDKKYGAVVSGMKRLGLHARVLGFRHPVTAEDLRFETPVPAAFLRLCP